MDRLSSASKHDNVRAYQQERAKVCDPIIQFFDEYANEKNSAANNAGKPNTMAADLVQQLQQQVSGATNQTNGMGPPSGNSAFYPVAGAAARRLEIIESP